MGKQYETVGAQIGVCNNCSQRAELHEDHDGRWVCENCLMSPKSSGIPTHTPSVSSRKNEVIDFIVATASEEWIEIYAKTKVEEYATQLQKPGAWIGLLEAEPNERMLLRMAAQLGYKVQVQVKKEVNPGMGKGKKGKPRPKKGGE